jgi:hypothetical protein
MADNNIVYMADIILPVTQTETNPNSWLYLVFLLIVLGIFAYLWKYYTSPLNTILRQLKKENISAREGAHQLAKLLTNKSPLTLQLDQLRFCRQDPSQADLLNLIDQLKKKDSQVRKVLNV